MPRFRFTVRWLMLAVAIGGVVLGVTELKRRRVVYLAEAEKYAAEAATALADEKTDSGIAAFCREEARDLKAIAQRLRLPSPNPYEAEAASKESEAEFWDMLTSDAHFQADRALQRQKRFDSAARRPWLALALEPRETAPGPPPDIESPSESERKAADAIRMALDQCKRGLECAEKGEFEQAITAHTEAIRLDPTLTCAFYGRGYARARSGDVDGAIADFTEAVRLDPASAAAREERGAVWLDKGDGVRAKADLDAALKLDPDSSTAYFFRGQSRELCEDRGGAIDDYSEAIARLPEFAAYYLYRGRVWHNKGEFDKAITDCTEAIQLDPNDGFAYFSRAASLKSKGEISRADADFAQAARLDPQLKQRP